MHPNDYRRIAGLLERVLHHLHEILEILSRDERFRDEIRHLPAPIYVLRVQDMREELSEVREALRVVSSKIDYLVTHTHAPEIIMKGMCPYCHKDLVAYLDLDNDELRLRCRDPTTEECKAYAWAVTKVRQVPLF